MSSARAPPYTPPTSAPAEWDRSAAIRYAETAVGVELHTIPLYLYSMYSIKDENGGASVRGKIREVVEEEMLHLTLAGNLLNALGGAVALYDPQFIPQYPTRIFYEKVDMNLHYVDLRALKSFIRIETKYPPSPEVGEILYGDVVPASRAPAEPLDEFHSIGKFYEKFEIGIGKLNNSDFTNDKGQQFPDFKGKDVVIRDVQSAKDALDKIIEQGEGNKDTAAEPSHCDTFVKLYTDIKSKTSKIEYYQVPENPKTEYYRDSVFVYKLSLTFDAAYCYLLQTIQRVWGTGKEAPELRKRLINTVYKLMSKVLAPTADLLVKQPWKQGSAAPCFNMYPPGGDPLEPENLLEQLKKEATEASEACPPEASEKVKGIVASINALAK